MFDIGFSEIVVIGVVALIVIGPERLPKTARTLGHLFGRLQRYVNDVKADINREMELDELRRLKQQVQGAGAGPAAVGDERRQARSSRVCAASSSSSTTPGARRRSPSTRRAMAHVPSHPRRRPPAEPSPPERQPSLPGFDKI
jgi:sec-independent protein translocase protein TatB